MVLGEMTGGILLACVPTFGPLVFSDRRNREQHRDQHADHSIETIGSKPTKRKKLLGTTLVDSLFTSKTDTTNQGEELEDALQMRGADMGYEDQRATSEGSERHA